MPLANAHRLAMRSFDPGSPVKPRVNPAWMPRHLDAVPEAQAEPADRPREAASEPCCALLRPAAAPSLRPPLTPVAPGRDSRRMQRNSGGY